MASHNAILNWRTEGSFEPGFFIGSEGDNGEHLHESDAGWPYSIYRKTNQVGGCDVVLCHGIQNKHDAELLLTMCNAFEPEARFAANRPGDQAAVYAEETGVDYATALVHCNMD